MKLTAFSQQSARPEKKPLEKLIEGTANNLSTFINKII